MLLSSVAKLSFQNICYITSAQCDYIARHDSGTKERINNGAGKFVGTGYLKSSIETFLV